MGTPPSRRAALGTICRHCTGIAGVLTGLQAAAQTTPAPEPATATTSARLTRPAADTEEGGLWSLMDREEARLRRSPLTLKDKGLTTYLQDLVCRLNDGNCPDIRVHVVRTPLFNASMAPNGMLQIWSGLLLRVENEAQLAAILGHELGHYMERHSLARLRDQKSRAAFAQFLGMFGLVGAIGQLGTLASAFAFSREHEIQADRIGMQLMQHAGYDGRQAAQVWDNLLGELKVTGGEDAGRKSPMFATHPPAENRRDELLKIAGSSTGQTGQPQYQKTIATWRLGWMQDEVRRGQFEESLVLFSRMLQQNQQDAQALFARAEVYRQRAIKDDQEQALNDLNLASTLPQAPPETWRALGLIHKQQASAPLAVAAFDKYLTLVPDAADGNLIKSYLAELTP
jgi:predicted Zn-dependent protease